MKKLFLKNKIFIAISGCLLVIFIAFIDYLTGYEMGLSVLYLIPVFITSFVISKHVGIFVAILAAVLWTASNILAGKPYSYSFIRYWNVTGRAILLMVFAYLVSELKRGFEKEREFARKDYVTGVANSLAFFERIRLEVDRSKRYHSPLTIAYLDCDNFKYINDKFGHQKGNEVLRLIADTIRDSIRSIDMVARLGGDEFIILLPETGDEAASTVLSRIKNHLSQILRENKYLISASIGVATFNKPLDSIDEMIKSADSLMYLAKKNGGNIVKYSFGR